MKQAIAQSSLKRPDVKADSGLRQSKLRRRLGEIQVPRSGFKCAQPSEVDLFVQHGLSPNLFAYKAHLSSF
jgi:hypothetical protein